jgi:hypothetical protein
MQYVSHELTVSWVMWEAKAAPGQADALLDWLIRRAPEAAQIYRSADRVVLIAELPLSVGNPPESLVARPPYSWEFDRLR